MEKTINEMRDIGDEGQDIYKLEVSACALKRDELKQVRDEIVEFKYGVLESDYVSASFVGSYEEVKKKLDELEQKGWSFM